MKGNKRLVPAARELRKNMTVQERHLWYDFLSTYPVKFTRQKIMCRYILDFYCARAKLAIELDGSQHYEEENIIADNERTRFLETLGIFVVRIPNIEVNRNFKGVCEYIDSIVLKRLMP